MFDSLFTPIKINKMILKNRIVAAPVNDTFEEKALGGAGMVIAGHSIIEPGLSSFKNKDEKSLFEKYERQSTRHRVLKIHQAGAKASIELFHAGQDARCKEYAKGPNAYIREDGVEVKAMDEAMMLETLDYYYQAASEAKKIGFDCIFMHFGHGWLPAQFLSPLFNYRTDEYGGTLENRARFPLRILETVRKAVGPDYPIDMRISAYEWKDGSIEFDDVLEFITMAEKYIDTVHISAGLDMDREANVHMATTNFEERMPNVKWAKEVKKVVAIPVSVVGAILSPEEANEIIEAGDVDMIACGRSFLADPYWPKKAMEGHPEEIAPCLRCLNCYHISSDHWNVGCSVNPRYNNESFIPRKIEKADEVKKVVIVGGGPAGIKAAITASQRGHEVILLEKSDQLGGQLKLIEKEYFKKEVSLLLDHLKYQLRNTTVDVKLNYNATRENIADLNPDVLIIAIGAEEKLPPIEGIKDNKKVLLATNAISKIEDLDKKIVILGGGTIGSELGLELSLLKGRDVTIIERGNELASQGNSLYKIALRQKMEKAKSLSVIFNSDCTKVGDKKIFITNSNKDTKEIDYDYLIVCTGLITNTKKVDSFYGLVPNTLVIGDSNKPSNIMNAIFEGHTIALNI